MIKACGFQHPENDKSECMNASVHMIPSPDLGKLHNYVDRQVERLEREKNAMRERLPIRPTVDVLATRLHELEDGIRDLTRRIAALEDLLTTPNPPEADS